jgi:hypothetical protein
MVTLDLLVIMLVVEGIDSDAPIYAGFGVSLVVYVLISLITRPSPAEMQGTGRPQLRVES